MTPRRVAASLLAALACTAALRAADANLTWTHAKARGRVVSDVRYTLEFTLTEKSPTYAGQATISFELSKVPRRLHLDFQGETLEKVLANGKRVAGAAIEEARVWIPGELLKKGPNQLELAYVNAYDNDGAGLHKIVDPADQREYVYTDFEPFDANRLFPSFDQPDLKASYAVTVNAPDSWVVISNGVELSATPAGDLVAHRFKRTKRFSTYIFNICAGPFASWTDAYARYPSRVLCTRSMAPHMDAGRIFKVTRQGFRFFERYFDIPYPFEKYDQIFLPQFNAGAMENVAAVTFNERMIYRHEPSDSELLNRANTILHEMAHMWFGDIVTMQWWNDLWLNESFATYMANLALARATRFEDAWDVFAKGTKSWAYWQDQLPTTHPIETAVPDTQTTFTNFDGITYGKGASVLKQLAFYVGEDAFREGVSSYLKRFRYKNATRADFMASIAEAAGRDLDRWTEVWLKTSGVNTITPRYEVDGKGRITRFYLEQGEGNGDAVLRPHRLQVAFYDRRGKKVRRRKVVTVEVAGARTRVKKLEGLAAPDFVYANEGDHAFAKVFLDPRSFEFAKGHLEKLPPMVKAGVWNAVWFMVRDGALAPGQYGELVLARLGAERDAKLVRSFRWTLDEYGDFLDAAGHEAWRTRWRALAKKNAAGAAKGSDLQKAWFDYYVGASRTPEDLAELRAAMDGKGGFPGLDVDQDRRWAILTRFAKAGHPDAAKLLAAEKARDPSERGKKAAYAAWVAQPDAAVKAEAWKQFLEDQQTPQDHLKAGMGQFFDRHQAELTKPYVEKFFAHLPVALEQRDTYFVRTFAGSCFPSDLAGHGVLERSKKALEEHPDWPYYLRRRLIEANDHLARVTRLRGGE